MSRYLYKGLLFIFLGIRILIENCYRECWTVKSILFINLRDSYAERLEPIYTAKKLGLNVILLADSDPNLDNGLIDELIIADTYDIKGTTELLKRNYKDRDISGVVTWGDKDVELVASIGEALNLKTISKQAAKVARNKYLMRLELNKVEGLSPKFCSIESFEDLNVAVKQMKFPAILKPVGASGSKSIYKINSIDEISEVYKLMLETTSPKKDKVYTYYPGQYILEEYLDGPEVSIEGVVQDGEVLIAGVTDKFVTEKYSLEYMEIFPSDKGKEIVLEIKEKVEKAIIALGYDNCAFHLEGRVTKDGFKVIEAAARAAGGFITSHVLKYASGYSFHEQVIKVAMGIDVQKNWPVFDSNAEKKIAHFDFLAKNAGEIKQIRGLSESMEIEGVKLLMPLKTIGDTVVLPPENFGSCYLATTILEGNSVKVIKDNIEKMKTKLEYVIK